MLALNVTGSPVANNINQSTSDAALLKKHGLPSGGTVYVKPDGKQVVYYNDGTRYVIGIDAVIQLYRPGEPLAINNPTYHLGELGVNDLDWRGTQRTFSEALDEAFRRTGIPKSAFSSTGKYGKDKHGKEYEVEWRTNNGAEVNIDWPDSNEEGPKHPHIGWQTPGKRGSGGAKRGHILLDEVPYSRGRIYDYKK